MIDTELQTLLDASKAEDAFKQAVLNFADGVDSDLIKNSPGSPRIKVLRVVMKLLEMFPDEVITNVRVEGISSCSGYRGMVTFSPEGNRAEFHWNCYWKAQQEDLKTWYGEPDQGKAAQKFGYQCFEIFKLVK